MKRKSLFSKISSFILPIILGIFPMNPAGAAGILNGVHYWTVDDLLQYDKEVLAEREAECGRDAACWEEYYIYHMDEAEDRMKFQNLENFNVESLVVSSINPSTGEIKIVYHGQEDWDKNHNPDSSPSFADELHLVWLDEGVADPGEDFSWFDPENQHFYPYYVDELKSGHLEPYTHQILHYEHSLTGKELPWDTEITIKSDSDLTGNGRESIYYTSIIGGIIRSGMIDYGSCLRNPYYKEGMECKFIYDIPNVPQFYPFTEAGEMATEATEPPAVVHEEPNTGTSETLTNGDSPASEDNLGEDDDANRENNSAKDNNLVEGNDSTNDGGASSDEAPKLPIKSSVADQQTPALGKGVGIKPKLLAPNTGVGQSECIKNIVFPWWFLGLLAIVDIFILWIFAPSRRRK